MANVRINKAALNRVAKDAIRTQVLPDVDRVLDEVFQTHKGKPVEEVKAELERLWTQRVPAAQMDDAGFTSIAQHISDGTPVKGRVGDTA